MVLNKKGELVPYEYHIKYTKVIHDGRSFESCASSTGGKIESEAFIQTDSSSITDTLEFRGCVDGDNPTRQIYVGFDFYTEVDNKVVYFLRNRPLAVIENHEYIKEDYPYTLELILKDN
jgi:hypothetical protein